MDASYKHPVVAVVGPTATGKTALGVALAEQFGGEVISADSMQIYRGMTIGTAAPTAAEMEGVPHHMIAVADPAEQWSAARFCQAADACIQDILSRGKLPVLAGGTGLYLDALIEELYAEPEPENSGETAEGTESKESEGAEPSEESEATE